MKSGPGTSDSSRNNRCGAGGSAAYASSIGEPEIVTSSRPARYAAATRNASGRCPHRDASSAWSPGPSSFSSNDADSAAENTSTGTVRAPFIAISPRRSSRDVTITRQDAVPGSSGRTWSGAEALSSTSSIRRPDSNDRSIVLCSSASGGISSGGTPSARRNRDSTSIPSAGGPSV